MRDSTAGLTGQHPQVTFRSLPQVLTVWRTAGLETGPFHDGLVSLRARYAFLGLARLLPLDRVMVGIRSEREGAYGGFHHPNQGYRHLQMRALITVSGPLTSGLPEDPELAALDLLRAYAHDCLHYGSFRSYRLRGEEIVRTQYGVNFRRHDGRTYSAPDLAGSPTTRNLGVIMEGVCDREARAVTRRIARQWGITRPEGMAGYVHRDATGTLTAADTAALSQPAHRAAHGPTEAARRFLESMRTYQRSVDVRYSRFLADVGRDEAADLHAVLLRAMLSGSLAGLSAWLDRRHGPRSFATLFLDPGYPADRPAPPAGSAPLA
ncbi:hypothetical protein NX801_19435 [Streptomyces sp. LP05-1]|uniref:Uncharacterized protein n=1 Tax=Streptomyces pyxinae TaxID=2970734 RepID=A0ABT2CK59_9ACTN|nr:hypothetical protein [Streptomyces sp. LP05-1]MCS0637797.1 hypothetical protein [Streptomyces sp. LP05-1]